MRCDAIREQMIDFIYDEGGEPAAGAEVREHLRTCSACRQELEELKEARKHLQFWKDEPPLRSITIGRYGEIVRRNNTRRYLAYAAIAAMVLLGFLAVANTQVKWNKDGFSFSTHLFARQGVERNYYTKEEMRSIMKKALDDTEFRMNETHLLLMHKMLETVEQDRWMDLHVSGGRAAQSRNFQIEETHRAGFPGTRSDR